MPSNGRLSLLLCAGLALMWRTRLKAQVDRPPGLLSDLPADGALHRVEAARRNSVFVLAADPLAGKATSTLRVFSPAAK